MGGFVDQYLDYALSDNQQIVPQSLRVWFPSAYIRATYPRTLADLHKRNLISKKLNALFLSSTHGMKLRHSYNTHIYFETEEDYLKACSIIGDYAIEFNEPAVKNISEVIDNLGSIEELRTCLYYNEYTYKIHLYAGYKSTLDEMHDIRDQLRNIDNVFLNVGFNRLPSVDNANNTRLFSSTYRIFNNRDYWKSSKYAVACKDEETASYISFMIGDRIDKITKAVLL